MSSALDLSYIKLSDSLSDNNDARALKLVLSFLLNSVSEDGSWRDTRADWPPMITTIAIDMLLQCGLKSDQTWSAMDGDYESCSLIKSYEYLNSQIKEDGSFGTDFWDACRLGEVIIKHNLKSYFSSFGRLNNYLVKKIQGNLLYEDKTEWIGPGFLAIALNYLDLNQMPNESEIFTKSLIEQQNPNGYWEGIRDKSGNLNVSPVWHTTQAISYLCKRNPVQYKINIEKAIKWLILAQEDDGRWAGADENQIYNTSYAIVAMLNARMKDSSPIIEALKFLKIKIEPSGRCADYCGTGMCAYALIEKLKVSNYDTLSILENIMCSKDLERVKKLQQEVQSLQQLCNENEKEIQSLQLKCHSQNKTIQSNENKISSLEKYKDETLLRLTKTQGFVITTSLTLITIFLKISGLLHF